MSARTRKMTRISRSDHRQAKRAGGYRRLHSQRVVARLSRQFGGEDWVYIGAMEGGGFLWAGPAGRMFGDG